MLLRKTSTSQNRPHPILRDPKHSSYQATELGEYRAFLQYFLDKQYQFVYFTELQHQVGQIALRHDIDFDTHFALKCAKIEKALGIKATYFFLLRSNFYNVLSVEDYKNITDIQKLGHCISIHFDASLYDDCKAGLLIEKKLFKNIFHVDVDIISFHRPKQHDLDCNKTIAGTEHTYQFKYVKDIKYFADSTGIWRYGHPFFAPEIEQQQSLHLLLHPVWWMVEGETNLEKLNNYFQQRINKLSNSFHDNCKPFRELYGYV